MNIIRRFMRKLEDLMEIRVDVDKAQPVLGGMIYLLSCLSSACFTGRFIAGRHLSVLCVLPSRPLPLWRKTRERYIG